LFFFVQEVNKPSPHLVATDSQILPFLRASVARIFKRSRDLDVAHDLGHAPF